MQPKRTLTLSQLLHPLLLNTQTARLNENACVFGFLLPFYADHFPEDSAVLAGFADLADLADLEGSWSLADSAGLGNRGSLVDSANPEDSWILADSSYRANLADLAYRANLADLAYRANLADLADLGNRANPAEHPYKCPL